MLLQIFGAIPLRHCGADAALNFLGLTAQHCRLIRHTNLNQMRVGIKSVGIRASEFFQELLLVAALDDIFANLIGFGEREDDKIMSTRRGSL